MKVISLLLILSATAYGQHKIEIEGSYLNRNIMVMNPPTVHMKSCLDSVQVNGIKIPVDVSETALEIPLTSLDLDCGDAVKIEFYHKNGCLPKVLGNSLITPRMTLKFGSVIVSKDGVIEWRTSEETLRGDFHVEAFLWGKWITIDEVEGNGGPCAADNKYEQKVALTAGKNRLRISKSHVGKSVHSEETSVISNLLPVEFSFDKAKKIVILSRPTYYEVRDLEENLLIKGQGNMINLSALAKGTYTVNYDSDSKELRLK